MKYIAPVLICFADGEPAPLCEDGSNAWSSGCTDGVSVSNYCGVGMGDEDNGCAQGIEAGACAAGGGADISAPSCLDGLNAYYPSCSDGGIV